MKQWLMVIGLTQLFSISALGQDLASQNKKMFQKLKTTHNLTDQQLKNIQKVFSKGPHISQGNPKVSEHPMTEAQCQAKLKKQGIDHYNPTFEKICGGKYMAPLYNPKTQRPEDSKVCIDQFEFPGSPCSYPVTWVRANEAAQICEAMGKRLCDAHEWEGACEGQLLPPDYPFEKVAGLPAGAAHKTMRNLHNRKYKRQWAYGPKFKKGICAQDSFKHKNCNGGNYKACGTNTYPAGAFPGCSNQLKVYDIHGNAAEHMNLPLKPDQMASHPSGKLGHTEMKGSWFIWDKFQAHQDWCRWRAPYWHGTTVRHKKSHHNYHLGFRCCLDTKKK